MTLITKHVLRPLRSLIDSLSFTHLFKKKYLIILFNLDVAFRRFSKSLID